MAFQDQNLQQPDDESVPSPAPTPGFIQKDPESQKVANAIDNLTGFQKPQGESDAIQPTTSPVDLVAGAAGNALGRAAVSDAGSVLGNQAGELNFGRGIKSGMNTWGDGEVTSAAKMSDKLVLDPGLSPQELHDAINSAIASGKISPQRGMQALNSIRSANPRQQFADGGMSEPLQDSPEAIQQSAAATPPTAPQTAPIAEPEAPTGIPVYDISGQQPVFGHMHPDDVHEAVASGKYSFPKGSKVPVFSPEGELGDVDASEAPSALKNGYRYATPDAIDEHTYGTTGQQALAGLEGVAKGVAGPLATGAEKLLGVPTKDVEGRAKVNPWTHGLGETAGLVGGALTGTGEGALLADAGELAAKVLGPKSGSILAKIGARSVSDAAQMALYQGGDEVSKLIQNDPNQSLGSATANIGLSGLLGGAVGGAFGSVSPLWSATVGDRASQVIEDFKGRLSFLKDNPDLNDSLLKELGDHYTGVKSAADEVYGPTGIKAKGISEAMPKMSPEIGEQAQKVATDLQARIAKMQGDPYSYPPRLTSKLQADLDNYLEKVTHPEAGSSDIFNAGQDLKQQLQGYSKFSKQLTPVDEGYDFVKDSKDMAHSLRTGLEDEKVWGKAGKLQQNINKAFTEYLPTLKDFESRFTTKVGGVPELDPAKVSTYLNQSGKGSAEIKKQMLQNFLDSSEKYSKVINDIHSALGSESPMKAASLAVTRSTLEKPSAGSKLADYFVKHGAAHLAGEGLATAVGTGVGSLVGQPGFGALVGEKALAPFFKSVLPALAKPLIEKANNSAGAKAAIDYATAIAKGDAMINRAAKSVFKSAGEVTTGHLLPTTTQRQKLDAQLQRLQQDPSGLTKVAGNIGHYLPDHATAIAATSANAVNYLNSLRPKPTSSLPLDSKLPPNPVKQAAYNQALDIANQPLSVVHKISQGTLTPSDVKTLNTVNPGAYQSLSKKLMGEMMDHISKGNTVPYKTRLQLSLFLGQPLDSTMTQAGIALAQPTPQQPQPATPQAPANRPKSSTSKLGNSAKGAMTASQSRESRSRES